MLEEGNLFLGGAGTDFSKKGGKGGNKTRRREIKLKSKISKDKWYRHRSKVDCRHRGVIEKSKTT